jgi:hypothetical protein
MSGDLFSGARPNIASDRNTDWIPLESIKTELAEAAYVYPDTYPDPVMKPYSGRVRVCILCAAAVGSWAIVIGLISLI